MATWKIETTTDGRYRLSWNGYPWPMEPKKSLEETDAYRKRLIERWPGEGAGFLFRTDSPSGHQRGGPWKYTYPDRDSGALVLGVIHTSRLRDAKEVLRHKLHRKRLPNGILWKLDN